MPQRTALVIEDSYATRKLVELVLSLDGFEVVECETGPNGLSRALDLKPDIVILDIALPGIDGWEVLRRLREDPIGADIPVVMVTAHDTAPLKQRPESALVDALVAKPFDVNDLRRVVERVLAGRSELSPSG